MPDRHLVILSGPMQGNRIPVPDRLTIGRNPNSGLKLDDLKVSRLHAVIEETRSGIMIRDLGSNNGTFVDDKPILEHYLVNGDMVRIGSVLMRYETDAPARPASSVRYKDGKETLEHSTIENLVQTFFSSAAGSGDTHDRLRDAQERLAALYRANQIFASERDPEKLFVQVMDQIAGLIPAHNGAILLKNRKTGSLDARYVWSAGGTKEVVISSSIVKEAIDSGEAVITMNATDDERFRAHESVIAGNISSAMCVPLIHQDETLGALYVDTRGTVISFGQSDLELLVALAGPAAIAIRNAQHEHEREQYVKLLERSYDDTLIVLADAIELRDHYTVGHTWRVSNFAVEIARQMGWTEDRVKLAQMGGIVHDVGKIAIDNAILSKPGRLTPEEYEAMKVHPERGARIMEDVSFLKPVVPFCLYHHEWYDGRGYPCGLKGAAIPIEGRLMAVADTFDAMTSHRPHREGIEPELALKEIIDGKGTQFDPVCVDALVACYGDGKLDRILKGSPKDGHSIACPFCSTFIPIPEGVHASEMFHCEVCRRRVRLVRQEDAYAGELVSETE